jgi:hypothetical protein
MKTILAFCTTVLTSYSLPYTPGGPYNTSSGPSPWRINVHLVPHTHDDVGWLKTIDELYLGGKNNIQISAVQFILDSVVDSLLVNGDRKFIYVEIAFFSRWWRRLNPERRNVVLGLINSGQLEFINGGWDSNDEATPTFVDVIDQHTMGTTFIAREFGTQYNPTVGWQVDPFGHSLFQAKAYAKMGMNSWFFGRSDSQDYAIRKATRKLESIHSGILAGSMDGYGPPTGFNWNIFSADDPLNDDDYLGEPNIEEKVDKFVEECMRRADTYDGPDERTKHIMLTMGSDFEYEYAHTWFSNLDKLIHYVNLDGRVNVFYSTPTLYTKARSEQVSKLSERSDYDWFPYCDSDKTAADSQGHLIKVDGHAFWTGYFSSRPLLKALVRKASTVLEMCRLSEIAATPPEIVEDKSSATWLLWEALSVVQHHDGVSGTSRQLVADDYTNRLEEGMNACFQLISKGLASRGLLSAEQPREENYIYKPFFGASDDPVTTPPNPEDIDYYFAYYNSSTGKTAERPDQASGAYIFRPDCPEGDVPACRPTRLPKDVPWIKHKISGGKISWSVGPIPQDNGDIGKEIVLIIEPRKPIQNNGVFFTDSNGYQWVRREVNQRLTWKNVVTDPVAGNYYPITSAIAIVDKDRAMIVETDRSVGGSSLQDNQIEIMVHRRIFVDDARGVGEPLDERTADHSPIIVEGETFISFAKSDGNPKNVPARVPLGHLRAPLSVPGHLKGLEAMVRMYAPQAPDPAIFVSHFHRINVPEICVVGENDCILIRFVHRDTESGKEVNLDLEKILHMFKISKVTETVLHAGRTVEDAEKLKIHWSADDAEKVQSATGMTRLIVIPGEIRTLIVEAKLIIPDTVRGPEHHATVIEII